MFILLFISISVFSQTQSHIDSALYYVTKNPNKALYHFNKIEKKRRFFYIDQINPYNLPEKNQIKFIKLRYKLLSFMEDYKGQLSLIDNVFKNTNYSKTLQIDLLAQAYFKLKNYKKQLSLYQEGLLLSKDTIAKHINYLKNIGWAYDLIGNKNKALTYYTKSKTELKVSKQDTLTKDYSDLLGKIGRVYTGKKEYAKALVTFNSQKLIGQQLNNTTDLTSYYCNMAELYMHKNEVNNAIIFYKKALQNALLNNKEDTVLLCFKKLYELKEKENDYKESFYYFKKYDSIKVALLNKKKLQKETLLKAELTHLNDLISLKKHKIYIRKTTLVRTTVIVTILLLITLLIRMVLILKKKNLKIDSVNNELLKRNKEKETLLKEIHHRVKNNLQLISSLLNIQSRYTDNEEVKSMFLDGKSRIKSMALVHQKLYENDHLDSVDFKSYLQQIIENLLVSYTSKTKVNYTIHTEENLAIDLSITLGLIFNEIITNSLKYNAEAASLNIEVTLLKEKEHYIFSVYDNGKGFDIQKVKQTKTLGLQLITILVKQLEAEKNNNII